MLNNKQAVLFDLDGTLVDSMWLWTAVDETYFAEKGIAVSEIEEFQKELEGMGFTDTAVFFKEKFGIGFHRYHKETLGGTGTG